MWAVRAVLLLATLVVASAKTPVYLHEFVVRVPEGIHKAYDIAREFNFRTVKRSVSMDDVFILSDHNDIRRRRRREAVEMKERLAAHPQVTYVHQEKVLERVKRYIVYDKQQELTFKRYADKSVFKRVDVSKERRQRNNIPEDMKFNDEYYCDQWYYNNYGQTGGTPGMDINVVPVWQKGFTGEGVVVVILDDGIDHEHEDLKDNYDPKASYDMNSNDTDPTPNKDVLGNNHGTSCAGEVAAAANNSICGVGVAYNSRIGGLRILDGQVTDRIESDALLFNNQYIDIYSASWGPNDDGKTLEAPGEMATNAFVTGATEGRGGKGSLFIWATGNGGADEDSCGCDGYVSSIYSISIGSISDEGLSTYYSEKCPATMAVTFTGGSNIAPGTKGYEGNPKINVVTTDWNNGCTENFIGTSAAAPMAAGMVALTLEANKDLTWRDMQYIVAKTSRIPNAKEDGWSYNGNNYHVNPHFGFGVMDAGRMVEAAQNWTTVPPQHICEMDGVLKDNGVVRPSGSLQLQLEFKDGDCHGNSMIRKLEHTQVHIKLNATVRGQVNLKLMSPYGTVSEILPVRPRDQADSGIHFTFMTVYNWGEDPLGTWSLIINDVTPDGNDITVEDWSMTFYGVSDPLQAHHQPTPKKNDAHIPNKSELSADMRNEKKMSDDVKIRKGTIDSQRRMMSKFAQRLENEEIEKIWKKAMELSEQEYQGRRNYNSPNYAERRSQAAGRKRAMEDAELEEFARLLDEYDY